MITAQQAKIYVKDPIRFGQERVILPETLKPIVFEQWQIDYVLKPLFYDLDEKGLRKYNTVIVGMPKKNGKSTFADFFGVNAAFCWEPFGEIIIAANAKDQASMIIYNKIRNSIQLEPDLRKACSPMHREKIEVHSTGTIIRCVAHQYETAAGLNPNLTLFDELWGFGERKFYDELTVVPTRENPLIAIFTYAGYEEEGLLWDLWMDGMEGKTIIDTGDPEIIVRQGARDKKMLMLWSNKNLSRWVTKEYIDGQRARLPPEVFARLHENRWVAAGSQFITEADIAKLHDTPWVIQLGPRTDRIVRYIVATDLGLSHDRACRVVGHYDPWTKKVLIDNIRIWQGTPEEHVPIKEVEDDLEWCAKTFGARTLVIDPWQMEYVIQRLSPYYNVVAFNFSSDVTHLSQALITALRTGTLKSYEEPELDKELKQTIIRQTPQGWRIDHPRRKINDIVISVGMMTLEAVRNMQWAGSDIDTKSFEEHNKPLASGLRGREF